MKNELIITYKPILKNVLLNGRKPDNMNGLNNGKRFVVN